MTEPTPPEPPTIVEDRRRPVLFLGLGILLAVVLAAVLFAGIGTGSRTASADGATATQSVAAGELAPGINAPTSSLLSLTVLPRSNPKAAPNFQLTDQAGRPVSMSQFRGKVVVFSANDDQCTDLCTLLANDVVAANADLGAAARDVVWLSVNANPFYPQVSAVKAWTDEHGLGSQANWYFGTAAPTALAAVWHDYGIYVQEDKATRTVDHSTEMFYVDPSGVERAVTEFGTAAADTALFSHGIAQLADDLLPASERVHVAGPDVPATTTGNATINATAPTFSLPYLQGGTGTFDLADDRKSYVVLDFWSSTCTACRSDLPQVEAAAKDLVPKGVDVVGVDVADRTAPARAMAAATGLTFPLVSDPDGVASGGERITGLPYTVILGPGGQVLIRHPGTITTEQLEYLLENLDSSLMPGG